MDLLRHGGVDVGQHHLARQSGFAGTGDAGDGDQALQRNLHVDVLQVVHVRALHVNPSLCFNFFDDATCLQRVLDGVHQVAAGLRVGGLHHIVHRALCHQPATALAGAGADVDDVGGGAYGVHVVLHHHQGVAFVAQLVQGAQQDLVVAGVQADGRLVQHVANPLQVAAQLRGQADALRLATAEGGRAPVEREVAQPDFFQKLQPALDFRDQIAGDVHLALAQAVGDLQFGDPFMDIGHAQRGDVGDADAFFLLIYLLNKRQTSPHAPSNSNVCRCSWRRRGW